MLHACDSNTEEHSNLLRSILGVPPCSILRTWRLRARTKNKYTRDDFSMLTIREPWLLEKIFYFYRFHLASRKRNRGYKIVKIHGKGPIGHGFPIGHYKEGRLMTEFHKLLYERWLRVGTSRNNLARKFWGFGNSLFWECNTFQVDAMRMLLQHGAYDAR
jgi:hypothetical protein